MRLRENKLLARILKTGDIGEILSELGFDYPEQDVIEKREAAAAAEYYARKGKKPPVSEEQAVEIERARDYRKRKKEEITSRAITLLYVKILGGMERGDPGLVERENMTDGQKAARERAADAAWKEAKRKIEREGISSELKQKAIESLKESKELTKKMQLAEKKKRKRPQKTG